MDEYKCLDEEPCPISKEAWDLLRHRIGCNSVKVEVYMAPYPSGMDWSKYMGVSDGENHVVSRNSWDRGDDGAPGDGG